MPDGYAMLLSPKKGETAVYGCHCPVDMVVHMRKVLGIPRSWYCALVMVKLKVLFTTHAAIHSQLMIINALPARLEENE